MKIFHFNYCLISIELLSKCSCIFDRQADGCKPNINAFTFTLIMFRDSNNLSALRYFLLTDHIGYVKGFIEAFLAVLFLRNDQASVRSHRFLNKDAFIKEDDRIIFRQ